MALALPRDLTVVCTVHGEMRYKVASDWWTCLGFDGEYCPSVLYMEDVADLLAGNENAHLRSKPGELIDRLKYVVIEYRKVEVTPLGHERPSRADRSRLESLVPEYKQ